MNRGSKVLILSIFLITVLSFFSSYYRIFVKMDYRMSVEVPCNTEIESCFLYTDEETNEKSYYKIVDKPISCKVTNVRSEKILTSPSRKAVN